MITKKLIFILAVGFFNYGYCDINEKIDLCNSCHSSENINNDLNIPSILGQEFFYIYTQLKDYKANRRKHEVMSVIASELTKDEMKKLADYFSKKAWMNFDSDHVFDSEEVLKIISSGGRNACIKCHLGFKGNSSIPALAGQKSQYLELIL